MKAGDGIVSLRSNYSVRESLDRCETQLQAAGIKVFARIDHAAEAQSVGLALRPTELLIFGNPKAGTPVMLSAPTAAIDLPLKLLAWQDDDGVVWLSFNDTDYLARRFGLTAEQVKSIPALTALVEHVAGR